MKKKDIILMVCLLFAAGLTYIIIRITGYTEGNRVVIMVDGSEYGSYPLDKDKEINVKSENGYNTVVILNGKVRIKDADCPDKYCVNQGVISRNGETLICLPHRLSVEVSTSNDDNEIDAVAE